jgi:S1-C subfamily serine protease
MAGTDERTVALDDRALRLRASGQAERVFPPAGQVVLGRDPACDVRIEDDLVSRQHVRFRHDGRRWVVEDLGSSRGTYIDGRKLVKPRDASGSFTVHLGSPEGGAEVGVITSGVHRPPPRRLVIVGVGACLLMVAAAITAAAFWRSSEPGLPDPTRLVASVPLVVVLNGEGDPCGVGSGSVVDEGLVLTNFHVVATRPECPNPSAGVLSGSDLTREIDELQPAQVVAVDPLLDLAVLRVDGLNAPPVERGDSRSVTAGDRLRVLGYPGYTTGDGMAVTVTDGIVSGIQGQDGVGEGAWFRTDALIAHGNSGGAAFSTSGRLIGVPTEVDVDISCEPDCVNFATIGNLRPVHFAEELIAQARTASPIPYGDPRLDVSLLDDGEPEPPEDSEPQPAAANVEIAKVVGVIGGESFTASPSLPAGVTGLEFHVRVDPGDVEATYEVVLSPPTGQPTSTTREVSGATDEVVTFALSGGRELPTGSYVVTVEMGDATASTSFTIG